MELTKKIFIKSDGRKFIQYHREVSWQNLGTKEPLLLDEGLVRPPHFEEPNIRYNEMRGEWVAISSSRNDRPFLPPPSYCPLCPVTHYAQDDHGRLCKTDVPMMSVPYEWASLENMFPGLGHGNQTGHCEVILYSADHNRPLSASSPEEILGLILVWQDRSREVGLRQDVRFVYIFENKGVEVGVTLHHPHGQLYGMNHIPPFIQRELKQAHSHHIKTGHCLICDLAIKESLGKRLVARTKNLIAYVPEAARYPYEVHITSLTHRPRMEDLNMGETEELSYLLKVLTTKYNLLMAREFPYIMGHHQVPHKAFDHLPIEVYEKSYHWHIEFYPPLRAPGKLKYLAGVESGTGLFINDTIPETKAAELRELKTPLDDLLQSQVATEEPQKKSTIYAPGRINLIGEHTDYNGGKVLPFAFDLKLKATFATFYRPKEGSPTISVTSSKQNPPFKVSLKELDDRVKKLAFDGRMDLSKPALDLRGELSAEERGSWQRYIIGILMEWWYYKQSFLNFSWNPLKPSPDDPSHIQIEISSDLPDGAGVSSSAALCMGVLYGLDQLYSDAFMPSKAIAAFKDYQNYSPISLDALAFHAMRVEHQFSGTRCGLMDQLAIAKSRASSFLMIDFGNPGPGEDKTPYAPLYPTLSVYLHPIFERYQWLLITSQVKHNLGSSPYNERRQSCEMGLSHIQSWWKTQNMAGETPSSLGMLSLITPFLDRLSPQRIQHEIIKSLLELKILPNKAMAQRVAHAIVENLRVENAIKALKWGSPLELHRAMLASHQSLAQDYEVSCPEIELLSSLLSDVAKKLNQSNKNLPTMIGPRMTGGGFGGSMIAGVLKEAADVVIQEITSHKSIYHNKTGLLPEVYKVRPESGLIAK